MTRPDRQAIADWIARDAVCFAFDPNLPPESRIDAVLRILAKWGQPEPKVGPSDEEICLWLLEQDSDSATWLDARLIRAALAKWGQPDAVEAHR